MRSLVVVAVAGVLSGCYDFPGPGGYGVPDPGPPGGGPTVVDGSGGYYSLVVEGADIDPSFGDGYPPAVYVAVTVGGVTGTTSEIDGDFDPTWNEAVIAADEGSFESGVDIQVWADAGGGPALAGETAFTPQPGDFDGSTIDLGGFDYVTDARIDLQPQ